MNKPETKKYMISSFGCQMNYADAERFASIIEEIGYVSADGINDADLIILNTCSIRQKAEDRILGLTRNMQKLKDSNPKLLIVLTGCMARRSWLNTKQSSGSPLQMGQEERASNLKKEMPWIDFVIESNDFYKLPELLGHPTNTGISDYFAYAPKAKNNFQAWVPISTGCDHFCSYCIVPYARGREVCRPASDIINETQKAIADGFKDITLLGQTVNRWTNPKFEPEFKKGRIGNTLISELNTKTLTQKEPKDFLQLLHFIDDIEGDYWLSFMSSHPNYLTDELIELMAKSKHIKPYIHFAMQSGSDTVLKKMNRKYSISEFIEKTKKLKRLIPNLGLSTDIIVGFPGETKEEFSKTARVMEMLEFDMAYISEYSPRKGTASALIKDNISRAEKTRRKKYLNDEILAKSALTFNQKMLNTTQKVLIEKKYKDDFLGRTDNNKEVQISNSQQLKIGEFASIKIASCTPWALRGIPNKNNSK